MGKEEGENAERPTPNAESRMEEGEGQWGKVLRVRHPPLHRAGRVVAAETAGAEFFFVMITLARGENAGSAKVTDGSFFIGWSTTGIRPMSCCNIRAIASCRVSSG